MNDYQETFQQGIRDLIAGYESKLGGAAIVKAVRNAFALECAHHWEEGNYMRGDKYADAALALRDLGN